MDGIKEVECVVLALKKGFCATSGSDEKIVLPDGMIVVEEVEVYET